MRYTRYCQLLLLFLVTGPLAWGQMGIGTNTPNSSAVLDISSTTRGLLPPRMTLSERNLIATPAAGLTIYNTTTNKLNNYNGTAWIEELTTTEQASIPTVFGYTGSVQTYTVPPGVTQITVTAKGAQGGTFPNVAPGQDAVGGSGAQTVATLNVTPNEVLNIYVGGAGQPGYGGNMPGGFNGGGGISSGDYGTTGGGATDIRRAGTALANRILVAGGGGGAGVGTTCNLGGSGGAPDGTAGACSGGGGGGTQSAGGAPGISLRPAGTLGNGGASIADYGAGAGGGGYYGGGCGGPSRGGGGGSSWVTTTGSAAISMVAGNNAGNGSLTIVPSPVYAAPAISGANFVNVNAASLTGVLPALNGNALTNLNAANLTGVLPALNGNAITNLNAANLTGTTLGTANGNALTNLNAANLTGTLGAVGGANLTNLNASNLSTGFIPAARYGNNIPAANVVGTIPVLSASSWASQNASANGYANMGGIIIQWGTANYSSNAPAGVIFPVAFNTVFVVTAVVNDASGSGAGANVPCKVMSPTNAFFLLAGTQVFSGDNVTKVRWMAIGK